MHRVCATFLRGCELLLKPMTYPARKMKPLTMSKMKSFFACLAVLHIAGACSGQCASLECGIETVAAFHMVSTQQVLESETWMKEAFLVGLATRMTQRQPKGEQHFNLLPGDPDRALEFRLLASSYRPEPGRLTLLYTQDGWFLALPSQERFELLLDNTQFPAK